MTSVLALFKAQTSLGRSAGGDAFTEDPNAKCFTRFVPFPSLPIYSSNTWSSDHCPLHGLRHTTNGPAEIANPITLSKQADCRLCLS